MQQGNVKIAFTLTVEVNPADWELAYGEYSDDDVLSYIDNQIKCSAAADEGAIVPAGVDLRYRRK